MATLTPRCVPKSTRLNKICSILFFQPNKIRFSHHHCMSSLALGLLRSSGSGDAFRPQSLDSPHGFLGGELWRLLPSLRLWFPLFFLWCTFPSWLHERFSAGPFQSSFDHPSPFLVSSPHPPALPWWSSSQRVRDLEALDVRSGDPW